ncbi:MAG: hypothetical protein RBT73_08285 [Spirochaetia bacterium]|nr:hypothetical protein [Spirochaetia bacterium]
MEDKKINTAASKPQPKGPSKREKTITMIVAIVFIIGLVAIALVQKANGAF